MSFVIVCIWVLTGHWLLMDGKNSLYSITKHNNLSGEKFTNIFYKFLTSQIVIHVNKLLANITFYFVLTIIYNAVYLLS